MNRPSHVPVGSCPCSPANNAAVLVMEGPAQPLSPPHPAAPSWEGAGGGSAQPLELLLDAGYFSVFVLCVTGRASVQKHRALYIKDGATMCDVTLSFLCLCDVFTGSHVKASLRPF